MGRMGDTELAHVTPEEKRLLKAMGGSGTINPRTGMPEYFSIPKISIPTPKIPTPNLGTFNIPSMVDLGLGGAGSGGTGSINIPSINLPSVDLPSMPSGGLNIGLNLTPPDWLIDLLKPKPSGATDTISLNNPQTSTNGGGGGGEDNTNTGDDVATDKTSEEFKKFLFDKAKSGFLKDTYTPYSETPGTRFAGFDPMQLKAFGAINQFVDEKGNVITPSQFTDAALAAGAIAGTGGTTGFQSTYSPGTSTSGFTAQTSTSEYNPNDYSVGFKTAGQDQEAFQRELDARMNPFTQGVINQLQKDISEQQQLALGRTGEQARAAGAFGGSRQGVAEALTSGRYGDAFARTAGQLRADQFNRAMSGADADRRAAEQFAQSGYGMSQQAQQARERFRQGAFGQSAQDRARAEQFRQGAFGQTEQAKQFADAARQRAAATRLAAASDLRTTGQAIDDTTASRINALSAAGKQRQALDQALKDFEYQQFLEERDFDKNQLLAAAGLLGSAPGDYYPPPPPQYYGRSGGLLGGIFDSLFGSTQLMG